MLERAARASEPCPACGTADARALYAWPSGMHVHRCPRCALLFTRPTPSAEQLEAFYQGFLYRRPARAKLPGLLAERERELVTLFSLEREPGENARRSFLDHGGGTGVAYAAARRLGLDSWFAEVDRQAIAFVTEELALPSSHLVTSLGEHSGRFDYVLSDNVIEHVPDPVQLIRELTACLKPGGVLVIKTPHAAATDMYFYPRVWSGYVQKVARSNGWASALGMLLRDPVWCCDPPRHLYSFTRESLAQLAQRAGIPAESYRLEAYETPLMKNTFTERALAPRRGVRGMFRRAALLPVLPAEWASKAVQQGARRARWLTSGGLILRVRRGAPISAQRYA